MSKNTHLRASDEFRRVYERGRKYDGRLLRAFVYPNALSQHRFGITASRKAVGNAVERNRAKRLLREMFRLSSPALDSLHQKYDWVFNAKRSLLSAKVGATLEEFQQMIERVGRDERDVAIADGRK